jgi:hypothetical protein
VKKKGLQVTVKFEDGKEKTVAYNQIEKYVPPETQEQEDLADLSVSPLELVIKELQVCHAYQHSHEPSPANLIK